METKREFKYFTIFDYEKEQDYLREMHKSGWKFTGVSGLVAYNFEKCEPEDVIYRLDYNRDAEKNRAEYIKMFEDCGWEYLMNFVGYSYFRKSATEASPDEEIFFDDESKKQMAERVFKGRMMPLLILLTCILIPQFVLNLTVHNNYILAAIFGALFALYLVIFIRFTTMYNKFKK